MAQVRTGQRNAPHYRCAPLTNTSSCHHTLSPTATTPPPAAATVHRAVAAGLCGRRHHRQPDGAHAGARGMVGVPQRPKLDRVHRQLLYEHRLRVGAARERRRGSTLHQEAAAVQAPRLPRHAQRVGREACQGGEVPGPLHSPRRGRGGTDSRGIHETVSLLTLSITPANPPLIVFIPVSIKLNTQSELRFLSTPINNLYNVLSL